MDRYSTAIRNSEKPDDLEERIEKIKEYFRVSLYRNIGRSLFQKDRLIFSILIALKLSKININLVDFFMPNADPSKLKMKIDKPKAEWITP